MRPLAVRIEQQEPAFVAMTDEQVRVMEACWHHPRLSVRGVAGSGKTFVAMELARRLVSEGHRTLFLCFNAPLARRVAAGLEGVVVRTFHRYVWECANQAGLAGEAPEKPQQAWYEHEAPKLLARALAALPDERFDAVIIDEGQDFRASWWVPALALLRDRDRSALHVFWDPDQDLHGGGPNADLGLFPMRLDYNCRNTRKVATYAAQFASCAPKFRPQTPDGDEVELLPCLDRDAMPSVVGEALRKLVDEGRVSTENIVVLSMHGRERSAVGSAGRAGRFALVDLDVERIAAGEVRFSSVHRFKGLEADVVVLCDVTLRDLAAARVPMHVGSSRARHCLIVVGDFSQGN